MKNDQEETKTHPARNLANQFESMSLAIDTQGTEFGTRQHHGQPENQMDMRQPQNDPQRQLAMMKKGVETRPRPKDLGNHCILPY